jgi:hypothetical protein
MPKATFTLHRGLTALAVGCLASVLVIGHIALRDSNLKSLALSDGGEGDLLEGKVDDTSILEGTSHAELSRKISAVDRFITEVENYRDRVRENRHFQYEDVQIPPTPLAGVDGVNWESLDCRLHGPAWESRALGCSRPGGCGMKSAVGRNNHLPSCGIKSGVCVAAFKACLRSGAAEGRRSIRESCECYRDLSPSVACGEGCSRSILADFADMATQCFAVDVLAGLCSACILAF